LRKRCDRLFDGARRKLVLLSCVSIKKGHIPVDDSIWTSHSLFWLLEEQSPLSSEAGCDTVSCRTFTSGEVSFIAFMIFSTSRIVPRFAQNDRDGADVLEWRLVWGAGA